MDRNIETGVLLYYRRNLSIEIYYHYEIFRVLSYFTSNVCFAIRNETSIYVNVCEEAIDFERSCKIIIQTPFYSFIVAQK